MTRTNGNFVTHRDGARVAAFSLDDDRLLFEAAPKLRDSVLELFDLAMGNHSDCDWRSNTECGAEQYGDGNADEHYTLRRAEEVIAKAPIKPKDPEFPRLDVVEADEVMPTPVQFICGYCQSTAIRFDADVEWDADNQTMSVVTTYDHRECSDCSSTDVKVQTFIKRVEEA
jgi:hypothetical protein